MTVEERRERWEVVRHGLGMFLAAMMIIPVAAVVLGGMRVTIHPGIGDGGPPPWPPLLDSTTTFLGERGGLYGWVVERPGEAPYTVYVTDDGHAVFGRLHAPDGTPLSDRQIEAARRATPAPEPAPGAWPEPDAESGEAEPSAALPFAAPAPLDPFERRVDPDPDTDGAGP